MWFNFLIPNPLLCLDPIQSLFIASIQSANSAGGLDNASPAVKAELEAELDRLAKQVSRDGILQSW